MQANGTGGRTDWSGTEQYPGDAYDHFVVTYWYPGRRARQLQLPPAQRRVQPTCACAAWAFTARPTPTTAALVRILSDRKDKAWNGTEKDDTFTGGCITNIKLFVDSRPQRQAGQQRAGRGGEQSDRRFSAAPPPTSSARLPGRR